MQVKNGRCAQNIGKQEHPGCCVLHIGSQGQDALHTGLVPSHKGGRSIPSRYLLPSGNFRFRYTGSCLHRVGKRSRDYVYTRHTVMFFAIIAYNERCPKICFPTGRFFPVAFFSKTENVVTFGYHNDSIGQGMQVALLPGCRGSCLSASTNDVLLDRRSPHWPYKNWTRIWNRSSLPSIQLLREAMIQLIYPISKICIVVLLIDHITGQACVR